MKTYIAGKITGLDNYKEVFARAESYLKLRGHTTVNPTGLYNILGDKFEHHEYMHICYSLIDLCDFVYCLDNWKDSKGARLEVEYAKAKNKIIVEMENTIWHHTKKYLITTDIQNKKEKNND